MRKRLILCLLPFAILGCQHPKTTVLPFNDYLLVQESPPLQGIDGPGIIVRDLKTGKVTRWEWIGDVPAKAGDTIITAGLVGKRWDYNRQIIVKLKKP